MNAKPVAIIVMLLVASAAAVPGRAQQLEPRTYSPAPVGANFFGLAYGNSSGNVLVDPSIPVTNVEADISSAGAFYVNTFGLFGRSASIGAALPYTWAEVEGDVGETLEKVTRSGLGDLGLRFMCNIVGGPALSAQEFAARKPTTTFGASLSVTAPTGQYDPSKLINIGTNRWGFKPELGVSQPLGKFWLEVYAGVWLFTTNHDFFGGHTREQDPMAAVQAHVSYTFKPRLWLALDGTWYGGGETTVDGVADADRQANTRFGLTLAVPVSKAHSLKFAYAKGASTRIGSKLSTITVGWQFVWFNRRAAAKAL
jgi:hypothetical protein